MHGPNIFLTNQPVRDTEINVWQTPGRGPVPVHEETVTGQAESTPN